VRPPLRPRARCTEARVGPFTDQFPFHLGERGLSEWALCADSGHSRDCDGAPRFDPLPTFAPEFYTS
jgi:hypothetical protein